MLTLDADLFTPLLSLLPSLFPPLFWPCDDSLSVSSLSPPYLRSFFLPLLIIFSFLLYFDDPPFSSSSLTFSWRFFWAYPPSINFFKSQKKALVSRMPHPFSLSILFLLL